MSLFEWIVVTLACILIFAVGYAGITGKSIFSYKKMSYKKNKKKPNSH